MISKKEFDTIIKNNLSDICGEEKFGYGNYELYYSESAFEQFKKEMETPQFKSFFKSYGEGKGNEFAPKARANGTTPPKMASVASSSRFCYLALRNGAEALGGSGKVEVEYGCKIDGIKGTAPQLDAYIKNENIFVEAKCHEIFDRHSMSMKKAYWDLVLGNKNDFGFEKKGNCLDDEFQIPYSEFGANKDTMFDLKQFLCHLLGVSKSKESEKAPAKLVYLFFKPACKNEKTQKQIDDVFDKLSKEVKSIFDSTPIQRFILKHNIKLEAVAECSEIMRDLTYENKIVLYG